MSDLEGYKGEYSNRTYSDFGGGLHNTSLATLLKENELGIMLNLELERTTGALTTCTGTTNIHKPNAGQNIDYIFYDSINNVFLYVDITTRKVYVSHFADSKGNIADENKYIGDLDGDSTPIFAIWEYGVLIASGGYLQYWDGDKLDTIKTANYENSEYKFAEGYEYLVDYWEQAGDTWDSTDWKPYNTYEVNEVVSVGSGEQLVDGYSDTKTITTAEGDTREVRYIGGWWWICDSAHTSSNKFDPSYWRPANGVKNYWKEDTKYYVDDVVAFVLDKQEKTFYPGALVDGKTIYLKNGDVITDENFESTTGESRFDWICFRCLADHTSGQEAKSDPPEQCNGVFVRDGRVYVWHDYMLECSAVGNERDWKNDSNDPSSAQWLYVGYKEGEEYTSHILGVTSLTHDIVILKEDGKVYRLTGSAGSDDWVLKEIARHLDCVSKHAYCNVQNGVFILNQNSLFYLETTNTYGDMFPENIAKKVAGVVMDTSSENSKLRYMPTLNQLWIIGTRPEILVYDLNYNLFFQRQFSDTITDVICANCEVLIAKSDNVSMLTAGVYRDEWTGDYDSGNKMTWKFLAKSYGSEFDSILRRTRVGYYPLSDEVIPGSAKIYTANKQIEIPLDNQREKTQAINDDLIIDDETLIYGSTARYDSQRSNYRNVVMDLEGKGTDCPVTIEGILQSITESGAD